MSLKPKILQQTFPQVNGLTIIEAPWRHKYFEQPKDDACFICRAIAAPPRRDAKNLLLVRGKDALIMLNRFPYTTGALMVAPYAHYGDFRAHADETLTEMNRLVKLSMNVLDAAFKPTAYNIGINQGKAAGAGLRDHLHIHVVPRWDGDTNFMTTIGGARVLAQDVDSMYKRLRQALKRVT
ncbi:MAG: AP-4-A phosphorylase [Anaerolineae bacterium]|nr:AP-4-A phosphorylase [Anaerolineae bacterium]RIK26829.1 MAG: HIT family hydrolase [Chloroflexota bacterium]